MHILTILSGSLSGVISFLGCILLLPLIGHVARKRNLFDVPGPLKIHSQRIARLGGIAMMAGLWAGIGIKVDAMPEADVLLLIVFSFVWAVGLGDDVRPLPPLARLAVHLLAGACFWALGWRLQWTHIAVANLIITVGFVAFYINAMNLLDGMDGLAAGTSAILAAGLLPLFSINHAQYPAFVAWGLLGVCMAQLTYNYPPARMFMGDSGSTLLGVVLSFLIVRATTIPLKAHVELVPILFAAVPLFDAILAIGRRCRTRTSPFRGDRSHFYDLLLHRGWSVPRVLWTSLAVTSASVTVGWLCLLNLISLTLAALIVLTFLSASAYLLGSLQSGIGNHHAADGRPPVLLPALGKPVPVNEDLWQQTQRREIGR